MQENLNKMPEAAQINAALSRRIDIARVLCIIGMIYVHVPHGLDAPPVLGLTVDSLFGNLRAFIVEGFGRASAALLSVVSGYLVCHALVGSGRSVGRLYRSRFKTIIIPMVIWGTITVAVYAVVSMTRETFLHIDFSSPADAILQYLNFVFFLTDLPVGPTMHLAFLRDLFVCVLLAPVLLGALRLSAPIVLLLLAALYFLDIRTMFMLRPLILFAFAMGMLVYMRAVDVRCMDKWLLPLAVGLIFTTLSLMSVNSGFITDFSYSRGQLTVDLSNTVLYPLARLFGTLTLWALTARLVQTQVGERIAFLKPLIFTAYCCHFFVLSLGFFVLWMPILGNASGPFYWVWFLGAPATALFSAWVLLSFCSGWLPAVARTLAGGRPLPDHLLPGFVVARRQANAGPG